MTGALRSRAMSAIEVTRVGTPEEMAHALRIRTCVFVDEQHVPLELEVDAYDGDPSTHERAGVLHVLARFDGVPVGTARLLLEPGEGETHEAGALAHIGRVAVLIKHRRAGIGAALMRALHDEAHRRGFGGIAISAQLHAVPFYEGLGYLADGPIYLEAGGCPLHYPLTRPF